MKRLSRFKFRLFLLLIVANSPFVSKSQTLYNRDAKITVTANTSLSVDGSVENQGTIFNNGHLKVAGPWINSGTYESGEGQITFNSISKTVPQIIHHNGQTFTSVTLSGGTKKVILSDVVITKEIRFKHGIVEAAGSARLIFDKDVIISGASDSSHVHGVVYQKGSGYKLFPLGNGSTYLPVELTHVDDPSAMIGIQAFESDNVALTKSPQLAFISDKRYWHINIISGAMSDSKIVLPLRGESALLDSDKVVVVESTSLTEDFTNIGGSITASTRGDGRVQSGVGVSKPFVALATAATRGELIVYNAVSKNGDGLNEFLRIENIESYGTNTFTVFNRWGDKIFEVENYNNSDRVFTGRANVGGDSALVSGTYFYVLELPGVESLRGFIAVKN
jgi:gliding motility-associated-like protein